MKINLIYGPPGTGKTTHLLTLLERLLEKYSPDEIAFVSFTKKGSYEGRDRAIERFGLSEKDLPFFRTLHSLAFRACGTARHNMMTPKYYRDFSKRMGMHFSGYYTEDFRSDDDKYLFFDILYRNNPKACGRFLQDMDMQKLHFIRHNYRRFREHFNLMDYTDLLEHFISEKLSLPVRVAIIDEAQDLTTLQWQFVWSAFSRAEAVYIAGDDDQAIYQWSGADVDYFLNLRGESTVLGHSYRLPRAVLDFSKRITDRIGRRVTKDFTPRDGDPGAVEFFAALPEIRIKASESYMFLSRTNAYADIVGNYLQGLGVPYYRDGAPAWDPALVRDARSYMTWQGKGETALISRTMKTRLKSLPEKGQPWFRVFKGEIGVLDYHRQMIAHDYDKKKIRIDVGTIHSVKGGEADNVILLSDMSRAVANNLEANPDSEHRVFYVGVTRTRRNLYIMNLKSNYLYPFTWR